VRTAFIVSIYASQAFERARAIMLPALLKADA